MILLAFAFAQVIDVTLGEHLEPPPNFPFTSNAGLDLGCQTGALKGSRFPVQVFDRAHKERIQYNVSRCTGGYIHAVDETTWRSWNVDVAPGGGLSGRDLRGDRWRYDRAQGAYENLTTHVRCATPDYRAMCAG